MFLILWTHRALYQQEHTEEENLQIHIQCMESMHTDGKAHSHLIHLKIMLNTRLPGGKISCCIPANSSVPYRLSGLALYKGAALLGFLSAASLSKIKYQIQLKSLCCTFFLINVRCITKKEYLLNRI